MNISYHQAVLSLVASMALSTPAVAQNDECAAAFALGLGSTTFTNVSATTSAPSWSCGLGGADLWYTYTASQDGAVIVDTLGSSYDTTLEVFEGTCGALQLLQCNDDFGSLQSRVVISSSANTTYFIRVGGFNGSMGAGVLTLSLPSSLLWQGLHHDPLGAAILSIDPGGSLLVNNLGSSGLDGVRTNLPSVNPAGPVYYHNVDFGEFDEGDAWPVGASLSIEHRAVVAGQQQQASMVTIGKSAARTYTVNADFSSLGAVSSIAEVRSNGALMATYTLSNTDDIIWYPPPNPAPQDGTIVVMPIPPWADLQMTSPPGSEYEFGGMRVPGDLLVITGQAPSLPSGRFTTASIRTTGVPTLKIRNESYTSNAVGTNYCMANANSTGMTGDIWAEGSNVAASNDLTLNAASLPPMAFGLFVVSRTQGFVMNPGGSDGNLCVGGSIGRYAGPGQLLNSGPSGSFSLTIDLSAIPQPFGFASVQAGDTWNFQAWSRDSGPSGATSNLTNGLEVSFI